MVICGEALNVSGNSKETSETNGSVVISPRYVSCPPKTSETYTFNGVTPLRLVKIILDIAIILFFYN